MPMDVYVAQARVGNMVRAVTKKTPDPVRRISSHLSFGTAMLRPICAVTNTHRELPPVHMGHSDKFFDHLVESSQGGKVLLTWKGSSILILVPPTDVSVVPDVLPGSWHGPRHDAKKLHMRHPPTQLKFAKVSVVAQGLLGASVRVEVVYGQSRISVTIPLDAVAVSTKLNLRSMFCFDAWVDWRQRTPTQWKAELRSWHAVILDLMHDCFAVLDFPLPSATAALQNFAAVHISAGGRSPANIVLPKKHNVRRRLGAADPEFTFAHGSDGALSSVFNEYSPTREFGRGCVFLSNTARVMNRRYIPSDNDIVHARLCAMGIQESRIHLEQGASAIKTYISPGDVFGSESVIYDVGGSRSMHHAWLPYLDAASAIIFRAFFFLPSYADHHHVH
ncbi:G-protein alpha subunit-domain-containing protein [Mycena olivaceomarginata]|nr:G-protein alpha subunit-domain-containing protein [Mycena olivaceomarginata]